MALNGAWRRLDKTISYHIHIWKFGSAGSPGPCHSFGKLKVCFRQMIDQREIFFGSLIDSTPGVRAATWWRHMARGKHCRFWGKLGILAASMLSWMMFTKYCIVTSICFMQLKRLNHVGMVFHRRFQVTVEDSHYLFFPLLSTLRVDGILDRDIGGPPRRWHPKGADCTGALPLEHWSTDNKDLPPKKLTRPLKRDHFKRKFIFHPLFFRGYVSFQRGNVLHELFHLIDFLNFVPPD